MALRGLLDNQLTDRLARPAPPGGPRARCARWRRRSPRRRSAWARTPRRGRRGARSLEPWGDERLGVDLRGCVGVRHLAGVGIAVADREGVQRLAVRGQHGTTGRIRAGLADVE